MAGGFPPPGLQQTSRGSSAATSQIAACISVGKSENVRTSLLLVIERGPAIAAIGVDNVARDDNAGARVEEGVAAILLVRGVSDFEVEFEEPTSSWTDKSTRESDACRAILIEDRRKNLVVGNCSAWRSFSKSRST